MSAIYKDYELTINNGFTMSFYLSFFSCHNNGVNNIKKVFKMISEAGGNVQEIAAAIIADFPTFEKISEKDIKISIANIRNAAGLPADVSAPVFDNDTVYSFSALKKLLGVKTKKQTYYISTMNYSTNDISAELVTGGYTFSFRGVDFGYNPKSKIITHLYSGSVFANLKQSGAKLNYSFFEMFDKIGELCVKAQKQINTFQDAAQNNHAINPEAVTALMPFDICSSSETASNSSSAVAPESCPENIRDNLGLNDVIENLELVADFTTARYCLGLNDSENELTLIYDFSDNFTAAALAEENDVDKDIPYTENVTAESVQCENAVVAVGSLTPSVAEASENTPNEYYHIEISPFTIHGDSTDEIFKCINHIDYKFNIYNRYFNDLTVLDGAELSDCIGCLLDIGDDLNHIAGILDISAAMRQKSELILNFYNSKITEIQKCNCSPAELLDIIHQLVSYEIPFEIPVRGFRIGVTSNKKAWIVALTMMCISISDMIYSKIQDICSERRRQNSNAA